MPALLDLLGPAGPGPSSLNQSVQCALSFRKGPEKAHSDGPSKMVDLQNIMLKHQNEGHQNKCASLSYPNCKTLHQFRGPKSSPACKGHLFSSTLGGSLHSYFSHTTNRFPPPAGYHPRSSPPATLPMSPDDLGPASGEKQSFTPCRPLG